MFQQSQPQVANLHDTHYRKHWSAAHSDASVVLPFLKSRANSDSRGPYHACITALSVPLRDLGFRLPSRSPGWPRAYRDACDGTATRFVTPHRDTRRHGLSTVSDGCVQPRIPAADAIHLSLSEAVTPWCTGRDVSLTERCFFIAAEMQMISTFFNRHFNIGAKPRGPSVETSVPTRIRLAAVVNDDKISGLSVWLSI